MPHTAQHTPFHDLYESLKKQSLEVDEQFHTHHPHVRGILQSLGTSLESFRSNSMHVITSGTLAASLFLSSPLLHTTSHAGALQIAQLSKQAREEQFSQELQGMLPNTIEQLTPEQKENITSMLETYWGIHAVPTYEGQQLNHQYGYMGAEQHLPRFPGDMLDDEDAIKESGITPGKGAWGYFAQSKEELTQEDREREKYYVAVQTLYLPDWNTNTTVLKEWYKYRKVVVVNPSNGKVIVCDIADAGPAKFTGKHFGGSPEVMEYLELHTGMKKGAVILYFLDESKQTMPLGPVEYHTKHGEREKEQTS